MRKLSLNLTTFSGSALAKEMCQSQAAQLSTAHHLATDERAQDVSFISTFVLIIDPLALVFISFTKKMRQGQSTESAAPHHPAADQHA